MNEENECNPYVLWNTTSAHPKSGGRKGPEPGGYFEATAGNGGNHRQLIPISLH
ncbi:MAG: hypothetical protein ACFHW5_09940 [Verrucomicrobiota bacterium]